MKVQRLKCIALSLLAVPMVVSATTYKDVNDAMKVATEQVSQWNSESDTILTSMTEGTKTAMVAYQRAIGEADQTGDFFAAMLGVSSNANDMQALLMVSEAQSTLMTAMATEGITQVQDVQSYLNQYQQVTDNAVSVLATTELVVKPLEQAQFDASSRVFAYQHTLERDEILGTLKTQPEGLWVQAFQTGLSNSELKSTNHTVAVGYGHLVNPQFTVGGYLSRSSFDLGYQVSSADISYQNGYGMGVYGLYQMGQYGLNVLVDYKHHHVTSSGYQVNRESQKSYGLLLDLDYKGLSGADYRLVPSVQYQYNRVVGGSAVNLHQLGAKLSGEFQVASNTSLFATMGLAGVYATNPLSVYHTTNVDIQSYAGYLNQYAQAGNTGFATPYEFITVQASGKRKNQADAQVSVKLAAKHQFNKQVSLSTTLGYNAYLRTKLKDFSYGLNFQYQF